MSDGNNGDGRSDEEFLLDILFSHKLSWVRGLLKDRSLPTSGTAADLRSRIEGYLDDGTLDNDDLVALLDDIEGWGDQHGYLYTASDVLVSELADEAKFKDMLRRNRALGLFNKQSPLILPDTPKLPSMRR